jgi:hypothetical protein
MIWPVTVELEACIEQLMYVYFSIIFCNWYYWPVIETWSGCLRCSALFQNSSVKDIPVAVKLEEKNFRYDLGCDSYHFEVKVKSYIRTGGQSASLSWCQVPILDPRPVFLLLSLIMFRQLRVCWYGAPSLTRSRVCSFQLLLGLDIRIFLGSESYGTHEHILLSIFFRLSRPGGPISFIYSHPPSQLESNTPPTYNLSARTAHKTLFIITLIGPYRKYRSSVA